MSGKRCKNCGKTGDIRYGFCGFPCMKEYEMEEKNMAKSQKQLLAEANAILSRSPSLAKAVKTIKANTEIKRRAISSGEKLYCERCDKTYTAKQAFFHNH